MLHSDVHLFTFENVPNTIDGIRHIVQMNTIIANLRRFPDCKDGLRG